MGHILPEVALRRVIEIGIAELRNGDKQNFDNIFASFNQPELERVFGQKQIDTIYTWFKDTEIPVTMAWSFTPDRIPMYSIHLASETEDEAKAAVGDYRGGAGFQDLESLGDNYSEINPNGDFEENVGVFTVMLDIGIHANRSADDVLWMYYILHYILFNKKRTLERMGLELQTFSASDYNKDSKYVADNVWSRWVRFRCTIQNTYRGIEATAPEGIDLEVDFESASSDSTEGNG